METEIVKILETHFNNKKKIDKARAELCLLFEIKRTDEPACCPMCKCEDFDKFGSWEDGDEYRCTKCKYEFEWDHYK